MKSLRLVHLFLIIIFISACASGGQGSVPPIFGGPTSTPLPPPKVGITPAPDAQAAVSAFLDALKSDDYEGMYAMLSQPSQEGISFEDFSSRWRNVLNEMSAASIEYTVMSSQLSPFDAEVGYNIIYKTVLAGDIQRDIIMRLANENGAWKVQWDETLILPELADGNLLAMDYNVPARGDIYDRDGKPIVTQAEAFAFGIQTGQINPDTRELLTRELGLLCGLDPLAIENQIDASGPGWYLPMCEGTRAEAQRLISVNPGGLVIQSYSSRYYHQTGLAPQAVGFSLSISPEEYDTYRRLGYNGSEKVGQQGIERWAEEYLAGQHGGTLRVVSPSGQIISTLGQSAPQAADSVYLTIDSNLQEYAQTALEFFRGAIVVMEVDTGRVLAMASSPDFDPNYFEPTNPNNIGLGNLLSSPTNPLLNRAAQGQYPLGSVFKIITMAAGLESGLYVKDSPYDCQYEFTELSDRILYDWTYEYCQQAIARGEACNTSSTTPSGLVTLQEGLMRSCNPYFWHIGNDLYSNWQRPNDIANMARGFGLGAPTGIEQIPEASGQILDPQSQVDAVNQAIGQGDVQVTPLQVARFIAAIANGGTLYRPQIVEKIQPIDGDLKLVFRPEANGVLPIRDENLQVIQEAMFWVTNFNRGTARFNIRGIQFDTAGKTGTAESGSGLPHAWFAGYTLNEEDRTGKPHIAIAVIVENIGQGSDYAAPIFRYMVEAYYFGSPGRSSYDFGTIGQPLPTPTPFGGFIPPSNDE
ncbi:MAG: penicillin-binding transpeptidase domain-containing protein [Anaerolineales bacterium]|nr:penicillin-binding transpeptidase domain-containing protein [Anaerolineales bacterium]